MSMCLDGLGVMIARGITPTRRAADLVVAWPASGCPQCRCPGGRDRVDIVLSEALAPVLGYLGNSGALLPVIRDEPWPDVNGQVTAMLFGPDGSGQSVFVMAGESLPERIMSVAGQVQEWGPGLRCRPAAQLRQVAVGAGNGLLRRGQATRSPGGSEHALALPGQEWLCSPSAVRL